jgi:PAS domain S-box-containing protein
MKILSVDDKVENLYLLESMLKGAGCGYEVVSAHNGLEALHKLDQEKFDLIISDILMPQMDGFELCRQVKQRHDLRHIPFIFYTATYTGKKDEEFGLRLGASRFIIKPVEPDDFLALLRGVIHDYAAGRIVSPPPPAEKEEVLLKAYNQRLVEKLDKKVQELEQLAQKLRMALEEKEGELAARRNAEKQIRLQAAALESAANSIVITDREGVILWVNAAFERLTGYSAAETVGQTHRLLESGRQPPEFFKAMWDTILTGHVWHGELVNKRKDGTLYYEEMTVTPVRDTPGEITHFIAIKQDITERKRAEEALRQVRDDLAQANADLERKVAKRTTQLAEANANLQNFAYTTAHDLRSPLRGILSFSEIVLNDYAPKVGEMGRSMLERINQSAIQMARLLDDLLEYSKMSAAELKLDRVNLRTAVSAALALLDADIRARNALVTVNEPLPDVVGHAATVVLLIHNLVSNALKFMPPGAQPQVCISAETSPHSAINLPTLQPSNPPISSSAEFVRLSVQDNGIGIAPEHLGKIFGAFQRLHDKQAYPGTGLGLAIVRKATERMGGRVGVESELGKGSRFWVDLRNANGLSASGSASSPL